MSKKYSLFSWGKGRRTAAAASVNGNGGDGAKVFLDEFVAEAATAAIPNGGSDVSSIGSGCDAEADIFTYHSRLSMSLGSVVKDPECLSCFVQYLEAEQALPLLKFYLDTNNFKTVALQQLNKCGEGPATHKSSKNPPYTLAEDQEDHKDDHNDRNNDDDAGDSDKDGEDCTDDVDTSRGRTNVPELRTLCDISMRKPLTDDEKSRIYAETTKQITQCHYSKACSDDDSGKADEVAQINAASIKDAIAIYRKYLITNAEHFVFLPLAIISQISLQLCQNDDSLSKAHAQRISANCFDGAQEFVLETLERTHLNDFLQSAFYCKYCVELIEQSAADGGARPLNICDVLFSEVTLFLFMEFLEQHGEREVLEFWTTAINFRKSYAGVLENESQAQSDAVIIYDRFFSLQSEGRPFMSDRVRSRVEESICAAGQVTQSFDFPLQVTAKYLAQRYLQEFLGSQIFAHYVRELKTKIHEKPSNETQQSGGTALGTLPSLERTISLKLSKKKNMHRRSTSIAECTNECATEQLRHISQVNSLLAMETTPFRPLNNGGSSLNIDEQHLTNPSLLWRRANSTETGLKFGRVNALGRYERDFETFDAFHNQNKLNWSLTMGGHRIKNAMRKLVNLPEDNVQEEIAWQVAEMIVKDVTSVTLNGSKADLQLV